MSPAAGGGKARSGGRDGREGPGPSPSPTKPAGVELRRAFLERRLSSPVSAESFPGGAAAVASFSCSVAPAAAPTREQFLPPLRAPFPEPALHPDPAPLSATLHGLKRATGGERRAKAPSGCSSGPAAAGVKKTKGHEEVGASPMKSPRPLFWA